MRGAENEDDDKEEKETTRKTLVKMLREQLAIDIVDEVSRAELCFHVYF